MLFGLPSLRIKGFYLAVATLAAQFFLSWCFIRVPWLYNNNVSGAIEVPSRYMFGIPITGATATPLTRYLVVLTIVVAHDMACLESGARPHRPDVDGGARHGSGGRADRHPAAADQALAFAVSSFYCGVAGALMVFFWYGGAEAAVFNVNQSFFILFMVIIGGLGSLIGSFFGAALIFILPILLRFSRRRSACRSIAATVEQLTFMIIGA